MTLSVASLAAAFGARYKAIKEDSRAKTLNSAASMPVMPCESPGV